MKKNLALPGLVLAAVVALVLGTFGTANAASMSAGKVKKIAAKVVAATAPTLSVAHAGTADTATNATQLGGKPASAYQNLSYRYRIPIGATASTTKTFSFPGLPAGTYLVSYNIFGSNATSLNCYVTPSAGGTPELFQPGHANGTNLDTSSAGVLTVNAPTITCNGGAAWTVYPFSDVLSQVAFTQINGIVDQGAANGANSRPAPSADRPQP